jgi:hypothetical protein
MRGMRLKGRGAEGWFACVVLLRRDEVPSWYRQRIVWEGLAGEASMRGALVSSCF